MYQNISFTTFLTLNARNEKPQRKPWQPFLQQKAVWFPQGSIFECQKDIQLSGKKRHPNPSAFHKKSKSPFFKIMTTQFSVHQMSFHFTVQSLLHVFSVWATQASTTGLNRKMFWSLNDIFLIKILNENEVSKTQILSEITSKEWQCNAKKRLKHGH